MQRRCTVRTVTIASAAAPSRLVAPALAAAAVLMFVLVGRADGAERAWSSYLAPAGACRAADDAAAPVSGAGSRGRVPVNWARATGESRAPPPALGAAAGSRAQGSERRVVWAVLAHAVRRSVTSAVNASGYRYATFGENLFAGTWGKATPREVVSAWLQSPPHRANILGGQFRHVGAAPVRANGLLGAGDAVVWTATFASPR